MVHWPRVPLRVVEALTGLLAVAGLMMLHWSFVELLERGPLLRRTQYGLVGAMVAATLYVLIWPPDAPVMVGVMCLVLAVQALVTASVVFRFSGEDVGLAGWMTGGALSLYAATLLMRALVTLAVQDAAVYGDWRRQVDRVWMVAMSAGEWSDCVRLYVSFGGEASAGTAVAGAGGRADGPAEPLGPEAGDDAGDSAVQPGEWARWRW